MMNVVKHSIALHSCYHASGSRRVDAAVADVWERSSMASVTLSACLYASVSTLKENGLSYRQQT